MFRKCSCTLPHLWPQSFRAAVFQWVRVGEEEPISVNAKWASDTFTYRNPSKKKRFGYSSGIHGLKTRATKTSFFNGRLSWQPILYNRLSNWQTTRANLISHISNFVTTIFQITSRKDCLRRLQILSYKLLITHVQHNSIKKNNLPNRLALIDAPVTVIPITSHLFITSTLCWLVNSFNWWCNCG